MTRPTSRTSTALWRSIRKRAITQAKHDGIDHCPLCGITLDYEKGQRPNSAEVDHIIPHSKGGPDHISNSRVICRHCNQSRGDGGPRKMKPRGAGVRTIDFRS